MKKTYTKRQRDRMRRQRRKVAFLAAVAAITAAVAAAKAAPRENPEPVVTESADYYATPEPTATPEPIILEPVAVYPCPLDDDLQQYIINSCRARQIDPALVMAMCGVESSYEVDHMGDGGESYGLMQIQPRWHSDRMERLGVSDLLDPWQNVAVGIDYLDELMDHDRGTAWALMAYNGGYGYADEMEDMGLVSEYAKKVMEQAEILTEGMTYKVDY